ncbi:MAG: hypothetical protein PHR45_03350 [Muribaculaceae bacterium]|nr:hypothetical protein [Muribaculaceae bacterium]
MVTTDNNCGRFTVSDAHIHNLKLIADVDICNLTSIDENNLLIFPDNFNRNDDKIADERIFSLTGNTLTTGNIMGFVGVNGSEISIQSRFTNNENEDFFLHYMLQKVFCINVFNLKHSYNQNNIFDFMLYLFPYYLKRALRQGLFKEYQRKTYNNANIRGQININQNIKKNIPFTGNVAYNVREYSYNNHITQLIRHTIEHIRSLNVGYNVLTNDYETANCVAQIVASTSSYDRNMRRYIINSNIKPILHPYFYQYSQLQKLCLQILRYEGLKYGNEKDKVYGLLFDGAWLWEEYLNTILDKLDFKHPQNRIGKNAIYLFVKNATAKRYPDFFKDNIILDAKYKRLSEKKLQSIDRNDLHQIITYMYITRAKIGAVIAPNDNLSINTCPSPEILNGFGGKMMLLNLYIPQSTPCYDKFCAQIQQSERILVDYIKNIEIQI